MDCQLTELYAHRAASNYNRSDSVDISWQPDNRVGCTDTRSFVGVGSPNPLFARQRRFQVAVGRDMNLDLQSKINLPRPIWVFKPVSVNWRGNLAPTITKGFTNVNTP